MEHTNINHDVFLVWTKNFYSEFPYHNEESHVYGALQRLFELWGLNKDNPFQEYAHPGESVLIKPNWVRDYNPNGYNLDSLISHSSFIKHLIDFLVRAMDGRGTIIVADAPLQSCDFQRLINLSRIGDVINRAKQEHPSISFILEDWRLTRLKPGNIQTSDDQFGVKEITTHHVVDLGKESFLEDIAEYSDRFRVTCYKPSLMKNHHRYGTHQYLVSNRVFDVDFMINLAKMKTHIKAGLTGAMKNLIGINGHKEYLPHHIKGPYFKGGDNYCMPNWFKERYEDIYDYYWENFSNFSIFKRRALSSVLAALWEGSRFFGGERISAGSWRGNETVWRTTLDLNHLLYFMNHKRPRKILNIIDGIIAGEGEGPLSPTPKPAGLLIGGENPAYVDAVLAKLIGYNISRIPTVYNAIYHRKSKFTGPYLNDYSVASSQEDGKTKNIPFYKLPNLQFKKPRYWRGA